jgi:hypothetical protein
VALSVNLKKSLQKAPFLLKYNAKGLRAYSNQTTEEGKAMAAGKKVLTKGQLVSHFADKFDLTKKVAGEIVDEMASVAVTETKKKGAFVLPGMARRRWSGGRMGRILRLVNQSKSCQAVIKSGQRRLR